MAMGRNARHIVLCIGSYVIGSQTNPTIGKTWSGGWAGWGWLGWLGRLGWLGEGDGDGEGEGAL